jgi:RNA ligase (TIGR02306 family)
MSKFEVKVVRIDDVVDHPDADRLSLNKIGGFVAISNKHAPRLGVNSWIHRYQPGQLVVYVPEGAVVPLDVLKQHGYTDADGNGILAGSKGNRVKAIKLRGIVSQGLIFSIEQFEDINVLSRPGSLDPDMLGPLSVREGDDVAEWLGIVKYEPVIPASMSGDVFYCPALTLKFDIENQQKYPDVFNDDEIVYVTEKVHGTFAGFVFIDQAFADREGVDTSKLIPFGNNGYATAFSKGLGEKGLVFDANESNRAKNLYLRQLVQLLDSPAFVQTIADNVAYMGSKITVLGEIFGKGVQDLQYGTEKAQFAAFNIVSGGSQFMAAKAFYDGDGIAKDLVEQVPLLFVGEYGDLIANVTQYRDGKSFYDPNTIREGIVVVPAIEDQDERIGRKCLKLVSPDYLVRKGGTEYN